MLPQIQQRQHFPIIVGGTGLYLWSLLEGFSFSFPPANPTLRAELEQEKAGELYLRLQKVDPVAAAKIHPNNKKRLIRALEVLQTEKKLFSIAQKGRQSLPYNFILIGLTAPRAIIYKNIEERIDRMLEIGLVKEVQTLLQKGFSPALPSFQALGYKEAVKYLSGQWDQATFLIELKKRTRHFARRQNTWFRRFQNVAWFEQPFDSQAILDYIKSHL